MSLGFLIPGLATVSAVCQQANCQVASSLLGSIGTSVLACSGFPCRFFKALQTLNRVCHLFTDGTEPKKPLYTVPQVSEWCLASSDLVQMSQQQLREVLVHLP